MDQKAVHYYKGELLSNLFIIIVGLIYLILALILFNIDNNIYTGFATSLIPFGLFFFGVNLGPSFKMNKIIKVLKRDDSQVRDILKDEREKVLAFLEGYERLVTLFSAMFVASIILIAVACLSSFSDHLIGMTVGICLSSAILLSDHLISSFRKKLFLHEINKYFGN